ALEDEHDNWTRPQHRYTEPARSGCQAARAASTQRGLARVARAEQDFETALLRHAFDIPCRVGQFAELDIIESLERQRRTPFGRRGTFSARARSAQRAHRRAT